MALLDGQLTSRRFQLTVRWSLVVALWALLMSMASGQAGISNYLELVNKKNILVDVNMRLKVENQLLEEKIKILRTNSSEQIRFLKEEFGYVQPGEYVYRFDKRNVEPKKKHNKPQTSEVQAGNPNG
ncbi:MAG: FtsB family cell division protein [Silvanigrellaceae bacterium]